MNVYWKKLSWIDQKKKNLGLTLCYVNLFEYITDFAEKRCVQIDTLTGTRNKVNNMEKHALQSYYDNIDFYINDAIKTNNKLQYWKLLKDDFHIKPTMDFPPLQYTTHSGESKYMFSDMGKINALNDYFSSIANVDDKDTIYQAIIHCVMKH